MKKLFLALTLFVLPVFAQAPSIPTRAFDVRNGNGVVDNGTTYPAAIVIPFQGRSCQAKMAGRLRRSKQLGKSNATANQASLRAGWPQAVDEATSESRP